MSIFMASACTRCGRARTPVDGRMPEPPSAPVERDPFRYQVRRSILINNGTDASGGRPSPLEVGHARRHRLCRRRRSAAHPYDAAADRAGSHRRRRRREDPDRAGQGAVVAHGGRPARRPAARRRLRHRDRPLLSSTPPIAERGPVRGCRGRDAEEPTAAFHAQQVYGTAARTLAAFETALGRRLPWGFGNHQLDLVPHAFAEANAYYSREDRALLFGYVPAEPSGEAVYTCLSHDVVVHETTHAVLDGLRRALPRAGPSRSGRLPRGLRRHRRAAVGVLDASGHRAGARPGRQERPHQARARRARGARARTCSRRRRGDRRRAHAGRAARSASRR